MVDRRSFLLGLGAALAAPVVVRASSLMPISAAKLFLPTLEVIGAIKPIAGPIPDGWIECNGRWLSRQSHSDLYAILGDKYGGSRSDVFHLPDLTAQAQSEREKGGIVGRFIIYGGPQHVSHKASIDVITQGHSGRRMATFDPRFDIHKDFA